MDLHIANYKNWATYVTEQGLLKATNFFTLIYQPMMISIPAASRIVNPSGNLLDLSTNYGDQMWMAATISWLAPAGDTTGHSMITDIINDVVSYTKATYPNVAPSNFVPGGDQQHIYVPAVFMNDAMADQKVLQGYGDATYQRLKVIQKEYDPIGFFPGRTSGFKLT